MTSSESLHILQMVESGQVSIEDALGLMSVVKKPLPSPATLDASRWLRLKVLNLATGKPQVQVNLPLQWVKWGLTVGAHFSPELKDIDLDELIAALDQDAVGRILEVENVQENQRVEIFVD